MARGHEQYHIPTPRTELDRLLQELEHIQRQKNCLRERKMEVQSRIRSLQDVSLFQQEEQILFEAVYE